MSLYMTQVFHYLLCFSNNLATLALLSPPSAIQDARSGDSLTVYMGKWLGVPALPYIVSFLFMIVCQTHNSFLFSFLFESKSFCLCGILEIGALKNH